jgi:hypothetical protein
MDMGNLGKTAGDAMRGQAGGMVTQQAESMIDGVVDQAMNLIQQRMPAASGKTDMAKQRIKDVVHQELGKLTS